MMKMMQGGGMGGAGGAGGMDFEKMMASMNAGANDNDTPEEESDDEGPPALEEE